MRRALFWHCPSLLHIVRCPPRPCCRYAYVRLLAVRVAGGDSGHGLWSLEARGQLGRVVTGAQVEEVVRGRGQRAVQGRGLQQPLQHAAGAAMLQALVRRQRVLGPVPPVAELAHVQRVRLLVLVLEVSLQGIVTRECPAAVRTLLGLVDAPGGGRGHAEGRHSCNTKKNIRPRPQPARLARTYHV